MKGKKKIKVDGNIAIQRKSVGKNCRNQKAPPGSGITTCPPRFLDFATLSRVESNFFEPYVYPW